MINIISMLEDLYSEGETGSNGSYRQCEITVMTRYHCNVKGRFRLGGGTRRW